VLGAVEQFILLAQEGHSSFDSGVKSRHLGAVATFGGDGSPD
jgi:hypothetical protein